MLESVTYPSKTAFREQCKREDCIELSGSSIFKNSCDHFKRQLNDEQLLRLREVIRDNALYPAESFSFDFLKMQATIALNFSERRFDVFLEGLAQGKERN